MMRYPIKNLKIDPMTFDCPPVNYDIVNDKGWLFLARTIIQENSNITQVIGNAQTYYEKRKALENLPFLQRSKDYC